MFSLRSRAVRFRQLWMETRLELIYNVVIATRPAPNTPTKPVDTRRAISLELERKSLVVQSGGNLGHQRAIAAPETLWR